MTLANAAGGLEVRVAPGYETALTFQMPLARNGVEVTVGRERLKRLDVTERRITLEPATELSPGERLLLTVRLADGRAPERVVLALVAGPVEVDTPVTVTRQPSTVGELLVDLEETRAQLEETRQQLQTRHPSARNGVAELVFAARRQGVLLHQDAVRKLPEKSFGVEAVTLSFHRAPGHFLLAVGFRVTSAASVMEPWTVDQVRLTHLATSRQPRVLSIEMHPPRFKVGEEVLVVVEFESLEFQDRQRFRLECENHPGQPSVKWEEVLL